MSAPVLAGAEGIIAGPVPVGTEHVIVMAMSVGTIDSVMFMVVICRNSVACVMEL